MTKEERQMQKIIREKAKEQRNGGKDVKIGFGKLRINGIWKKWEKETPEIAE